MGVQKAFYADEKDLGEGEIYATRERGSCRSEDIEGERGHGLQHTTWKSWV